MTWLYVTEPGARIGKKGGNIVLSRANEVICEIPSETVEGVTIIDSVQVSSPVITVFLEKQIPVTWLSTGGKYYGRLESTMAHDVFRQKEQYDLIEDEGFCLQLAKKIVFCKIYNQRTILRSYNRRAQLEPVDVLYQKIKYLTEKIHGAETVEAVMGYEGSIARNYFQALGQLLPEKFSFTTRTRRPPKDRFNSMLSFGYTLLLYDFYTAIQNTGLHPYIGFLHALRNGHPALASDLMEPWRPAIVDSLCLSLVSHKEMDPDFFEETDDGGVYLNRIGRKIFIKEYERKMRMINTYFGGKYSWRHTIQMESDSYRIAIHQKDVNMLKTLVIR